MKSFFSSFTAKKICILGVSLLALALPLSAGAITIVPSCATGTDVPGVECILQGFLSIAQAVLAVSGGVALLMFVYGGFTMLSSAGRQEMVTKGKNILTAAVIGLVIILLAGYVVRYGLSRLGVESQFLETPKTQTTGQ